MHSFYIEAPVDGVAALAPEEAKHALKVLRLRLGDEVCAMDGAGRRWRGEIGGIEGSRVSVNLLEPLPDNEAPVRVTVYEGLPKADKLDFIAQKLTASPVKSAVTISKHLLTTTSRLLSGARSTACICTIAMSTVRFVAKRR